MRHTKGHTGNRRSHHALGKSAMTLDNQDGKHLRHRVSPISGTYKGKQVINVTKKLNKKNKSE